MSKLFFMNDKSACEMSAGQFEKEADLQKIIADNPNLLVRSYDDMQVSKYYLVEREFGVPVMDGSGNEYSLDHLMVDDAGVPVLVEVKRSSDTRIRREVVAQMIDYACRASTWDANKLRDRFLLFNPASAVPSEMLTDEFWMTVSRNLAEEHFRMVFVADRIPDTLKVMVEFLDRSMKEIEVYAVSLTPYRFDDKLMLASEIIGNPLPSETKASSSRPASKRVWTEASFFETVKSSDPEVEETINKLFAYASELGLTTKFGTGSKQATVAFKQNGITVFGISQLSNGAAFTVEFYRQFLEKLNETRDSFAQVLSEMNDLFPEGQNCFRKTDSGIYLPVAQLNSSNTVNGLKQIILGLIS